MEQITNEHRIQRTLRSKIPPSSRYFIKPGDLARVYREGPKKWVVPVEVVKS